MTAAERWIDEQTGSVDHDGDTVHAAVTVDLNVDSIVTVQRIHATGERPQGLALDADQPLMVGDVTNTRMVLWSHSAPDEVEIVARAGRLTLWNVWEADGAVHAWSAPRACSSTKPPGTPPDFGHQTVSATAPSTSRSRFASAQPASLEGDPRPVPCERPNLRTDGVSERSNGASFDKGHRS